MYKIKASIFRSYLLPQEFGLTFPKFFTQRTKPYQENHEKIVICIRGMSENMTKKVMSSIRG